MSDDPQHPFVDVQPVEGGFSLPALKWRELLFVGALRADGDAFVRDPARVLPPFRAAGLFPAGARFHAAWEGERVVVTTTGAPAARAPLRLDAALARRVEAADAEILARSAAACAGLRPERGARSLRVAGGVAAWLGPESPLSHAAGIGSAGPVGAADLDALDALYGDAPAEIDLCPIFASGLLDELAARGYRLQALENMLVRPLDPGEDFPAPGDILFSIRPVESPGELATWASVLAGSFAPGVESPALTEVGEVMARVSSPALLAELRGQPAGAAGVSESGGVGFFFADGTLPAARGHGVQQALIAHRLALLLAAGADLAAAVTEPASVSQRHYEAAGFRVAYTRANLVRPAR